VTSASSKDVTSNLARRLSTRNPLKRQIAGEAHGFDGAKMIKGRKRPILVDTLGLHIAVVVTAAKVRLGDRQAFQSGQRFLSLA
jgi:hypothetical protein